MKKHLKTAAFIITEIVLYGLLLWADNVDTQKICYASIAVCLFFGTISIKKTDDVFICLGLLFSLLADTFLVLLYPADFYTGVSLFMVVQVIYTLRIVLLYDGNFVLRALHLALAAMLIATMLNAVYTVFGEQTNKLHLLSVAYFAVFIINTVFAFVGFKKNPLFAIGLTLFITCDLIIGLQFIDSFTPFAAGTFLYKLTHVAVNLPWVFYLPGQVMITLGRKRDCVKTLKAN